MITSIPLSSALTSRAGVLAGWLGLIALLAVAIPSRLLNLEQFAGKFDEGIRGTQLMLMAAGHRPFREIFASQGPLSLDVFYPTYALFGQTLGAARLAPALFSIVGIVVAAWTARHAGGLVAGAVTGLLLTLSPIFLKNSRLALVEVPALVPAIGAVGAALAYGRSGDRRWLVGAGALMALALAIKPIVAPALVPIGLAILLRGRASRRDWGWLRSGLLFSLALVTVLGAIVIVVGPGGVYDQMIRFRMASRQVEGWSLKENWAAISGEIADEQLVLPAAAVVIGLLLLACRPRVGLPLVGWAGRDARAAAGLHAAPVQARRDPAAADGAADRRRGRRGLASLGAARRACLARMVDAGGRRGPRSVVRRKPAAHPGARPPAGGRACRSRARRASTTRSACSPRSPGRPTS